MFQNNFGYDFQNIKNVYVSKLIFSFIRTNSILRPSNGVHRNKAPQKPIDDSRAVLPNLWSRGAREVLP